MSEQDLIVANLRAAGDIVANLRAAGDWGVGVREFGDTEVDRWVLQEGRARGFSLRGFSLLHGHRRGGCGMLWEVEEWWALDPLSASVFLLLLRSWLTVERPCPHCHGKDDGLTGDALTQASCRGPFHGETRRETIPAARLLLDAMSRMCPNCSPPAFGPSRKLRCDRCNQSGRVPGDPAARPYLHVLADDRQAHGDPLGGVLALWLSGQLRTEHVLGIETMTGEQLAAMLNDSKEPGVGIGFSTCGPVQVEHYGWIMLGCFCQDGVWLPVGHALRPVLEARPT